MPKSTRNGLKVAPLISQHKTWLDPAPETQRIFKKKRRRLKRSSKRSSKFNMRSNELFGLAKVCFGVSTQKLSKSEVNDLQANQLLSKSEVKGIQANQLVGTGFTTKATENSRCIVTCITIQWRRKRLFSSKNVRSDLVPNPHLHTGEFGTGKGYGACSVLVHTSSSLAVGSRHSPSSRTAAALLCARPEEPPGPHGRKCLGAYGR
jgi:hypothetical protein